METIIGIASTDKMEQLCQYAQDTMQVLISGRQDYRELFKFFNKYAEINKKYISGEDRDYPLSRPDNRGHYLVIIFKVYLKI